jgi:predicted deacylase
MKLWTLRSLLLAVMAATTVGCAALRASSTVPPATATVAIASPTRAMSAAPTATPSPTEVPAQYGREVLGESWQGRPIVGHWFGNGAHKVVAVGNIHGGTEENTHQLALELVAYYESNAYEVPSEVTLWIIPTANPDGLANHTRRNGRMVDLNRNADTDGDACAVNDWVSDTHTSEGLIKGGGGPYPFSEVETRLLRDFLDDADVAIFYHSMAGQIYVTSCADHPPSAELARVLSEATDYAFSREGWVAYPVTGAIVDYLAHRGVAAVEVELTNKTDTEFDRNLAGLTAAMRSLAQICQAD